MKFTKKPVTVEAEQWFKNGDHSQDDVFRAFEDTGLTPKEPREGKVVRYFRRPDISDNAKCQKCGNTMYVHGWIDTLEGGHIVCPGDWVITGVKGEKYPCKPDVFALTYSHAVPVKEVEPLAVLADRKGFSRVVIKNVGGANWIIYLDSKKELELKGPFTDSTYSASESKALAYLEGLNDKGER